MDKQNEVNKMKKANRVIRQLRPIDRRVNKYLDIRPKGLIEALKEYEVDAKKVMGCDLDDFVWEGAEPTVVVEILNDRNSSGNSYNWNSDIVFNWDTYRIDDREFLAVKFHISGDVRGNYTDLMLLDMTLDKFVEVLLDETTVEVMVPLNKRYNVFISTDATREGNVFGFVSLEDKEDNEFCSLYLYDKYISEIDTSERNKRKLTKQIKALFQEGGELHDMLVQE